MIYVLAATICGGYDDPLLKSANGQHKLIEFVLVSLIFTYLNQPRSLPGKQPVIAVGVDYPLEIDAAAHYQGEPFQWNTYPVSTPYASNEPFELGIGKGRSLLAAFRLRSLNGANALAVGRRLRFGPRHEPGESPRAAEPNGHGPF